MIKGWKSKEAKAVFEGATPKGFPSDLVKSARRKLTQLEAAQTVEDLRSPPGNRLEKLDGDRAGEWSIRVNDQFRICFRWSDDGPEDVEFTDYH